MFRDRRVFYKKGCFLVKVGVPGALTGLPTVHYISAALQYRTLLKAESLCQYCTVNAARNKFFNLL